MRIVVINIRLRLPSKSDVSRETTLRRDMEWMVIIKMNWKSSRKQTI